MHRRTEYIAMNFTPAEKKRLRKAAGKKPLAAFIRDTVLKNIP